MATWSTGGFSAKRLLGAREELVEMKNHVSKKMTYRIGLFITPNHASLVWLKIGTQTHSR
jgi:hypothetical protein